MNKKGFTLIELLAIIVILAVIAVITVPIILGIIDNAEMNSSKDSAYGFKDAVEKYYMRKAVQDPQMELPNGYINISELPEDFSVSGQAPSDGWVKLKKGIVEKFSLKYKDYVATMDNDKNVTSEKKQNVEPHVTNDYQEVEYLESTGTQYIDTGVIPNNTTGYQITLSIPNPSSDAFRYGCRQTSGTDSRFTLGAIRNQVYFGFGKNYGIDENKYNITANQVFTATCNFLNSRVCSINTSDKESTLEDIDINFTRSIILFGSDSAGSFTKQSQKVYNNKISQDEGIIRNFVPVIRKSDNKPGMLDLANLSNFFRFASTGSNTGSNTTIAYTKNSSEIILNRETTASASALGIDIDIPLKAGTYTISVEGLSVITAGTFDRIYIADENNNIIINYIMSNNPKTFTFESDKTIKRITFVFASTSEYTNHTVKIMLNEGTTALPYEPYGYKFYTNAGTGEFIAGPEI